MHFVIGKASVDETALAANYGDALAHTFACVAPPSETRRAETHMTAKLRYVARCVMWGVGLEGVVGGLGSYLLPRQHRCPFGCRTAVHPYGEALAIEIANGGPPSVASPVD